MANTAVCRAIAIIAYADFISHHTRLLLQSGILSRVCCNINYDISFCFFFALFWCQTCLFQFKRKKIPLAFSQSKKNSRKTILFCTNRIVICIHTHDRHSYDVRYSYGYSDKKKFHYYCNSSIEHRHVHDRTIFLWHVDATANIIVDGMTAIRRL